MRLACKYCGYCVEYENGRGWFPEYANELRQHVLDEHVRITAVEDRDDRGRLEEIMYGAIVDPGYSSNWPFSTTATIPGPREHPPYEPYPPGTKIPNC